jgi:hypothetical protein
VIDHIVPVKPLLKATPSSHMERMDSCWAAPIGNCGGGITREHLVSSSLFPYDQVEVQGYSWCREPKRIGVSSLTAKILCERHNNDLSPVDVAGAHAFDVFREAQKISNVREGMKLRRWKVVRHVIDGHGLERWCLKTLINISCDHDLPIGRDSVVPGRPSERLVRIAYGKESFLGRAGLYFVVRTGMLVKSEDVIQFSALIKHRTHIEGGLFSFRGNMLLLFLESEGPPIPLDGIAMNGEDLGNAQFNFHNEQIFVNTGKYRSQVIDIRW